MSDLSDFRHIVKISAQLAAIKTTAVSSIESPLFKHMANLFQVDRHIWSFLNFKRNNEVFAAVTSFCCIWLSNYYLWEAYKTFADSTPRMTVISSTNDPAFQSFLKMFHQHFRLALSVALVGDKRSHREVTEVYELLSKLPASGTGLGMEELIGIHYKNKKEFGSQFYIETLGLTSALKELCQTDFIDLKWLVMSRDFSSSDVSVAPLEELLKRFDPADPFFRCTPQI